MRIASLESLPWEHNTSSLKASRSPFWEATTRSPSFELIILSQGTAYLVTIVSTCQAVRNTLSGYPGARDLMDRLLFQYRAAFRPQLARCLFLYRRLRQVKNRLEKRKVTKRDPASRL